MSWSANDPFTWPLWLQLIFGIVFLAEAAVFAWQERNRKSRSAVRRVRIRHSQQDYAARLLERDARQLEDLYWQAHRRREAQYALAITFDRQVRASEMSQRLLQAVSE